MRFSVRGLAVVPMVLTLLAASACGGTGDAGPAASAGVDAKAPLYGKIPAAIRDAGVIKFAGDNHPPYRIVDPKTGTVTGIDKDIQDALAKELGLPTKIEIISSMPAALSGMLANRYDAFNGPVQDTADREKQFDAVVWMTTTTSYLVPAQGGAQVASSADLCGKRIAEVTGSVVESQAKKLSEWCAGKGKPPATLVPLADTNATLLATKAGRADASGLTLTGALYVMQQEPNVYDNFKQTAEQGAGTDQLALLAPKSASLGPVLLDAFKAIFQSGEYTRIMQKWGLQDAAVDAPKLNTAVGS
jgi:polar amino acid transport system substrate-binding protein